jgi:hypothetical protein
MMRLSFVYVLLISFLSTLNVDAQTARRVKFPSKDGVTITADMYETNPDYPWIVLFHMAQSSRGEFQKIAVKLNKLELNCMKAAIQKAYIIAGKPVIIFGSSYSGSLAIKLGSEMSQVKAVVAFSPGEYFGKKLDVAKTAAGLTKPTFIACGSDEKKYTDPIANAIRSNRKIYFAPPKGGAHGAACLDKGTDGETEYWIQMINFIQSVKKEY